MNTLPPNIKTRQHRIATIANPQDTETGLVIEIAASSDVPYRRQFGYETLVHTDDAIDYTRVLAGSCPLLYNHKNDEYIGIVENVWVTNGQLRAIVRLSKNSEFARQVSADILDGILRSISIGYEINEVVEGQKIDNVPQYLATKWTLYEISVVTTPADYQKAGIGRNTTSNDMENDMKKKSLEEVMAMVETLSPEEMTALLEQLAQDVNEVVEEDDMEVEVEKEYEAIDDVASQEEEMVLETAPAAKSRSQQEKNMSTQNNGSDKGAENTLRLVELATKYERTAELKQWIADGKKAEDVALEILETKSNEKKVGPAIHIKSNEKTDFAGAVRSWLGGNNSEIAERGIDQARQMGRSITPGTLYIPTNVPMIKRSLVSRAASAYGNDGANATGKEFLTFEETLREGALLSRVGGQVITLNDVATMPYFSTATVATPGLAETGSNSAGTVVVGLKTWAPKRIAARYEFSNMLGRLNGTYDFEAELYNDLLAEGVRIFDSQIWGGAGTLEIGGLSRDSNIAALNLSGSMSLASASLMIKEVAENNANLNNAVFVVDHTVYSQMFSTPSFGTGAGNSVLDVVQSIHPVFRTGYLPEVTTSRKTAMFGDFSKVTAATFGPVEIKRDDLTQLAAGKTILNMEMYADCVARNPEALVRWTNISY